MKRIKFESASGANVNALNGTVTIKGADKKGAVEVTLPIGILVETADNARAGARSYQDRKNAGTLESSPKGTWQELAISQWREIDVADLPMASEPTLALVFDKKTERQLSFPIPHEHARKVAHALLAQVEKRNGQPQDH